MTTVALPLWLLVLILLFAGVTALDRVLKPAVRWFFRRRIERLVARVNTRLDRKLHPFRFAARKDMVSRLAYDRQVLEAVTEHAAEAGIPAEVAFAEARRYAHEIVPSFSAYFYFGFGTRAARWFSRMLFRVRVGKVDAALAQIDPKATVIFVMNHRSNMDYVLVTWLVANRSAVSYAVGEWARIWPLSVLIRSMGAYFIRRKSRNALYRRVLARYVQMATDDGVTQAIFPEGGLSLDGRVGPAKMGLLSYVVADFTPGERDVLFVPVGLAYDRILEDRVLTTAAAAGTRTFRARPWVIFKSTVQIIWGRMRGTFKGFGTAAASFGPPISLRGFLETQDADPVEALGARLMAAIVQVVPMLPVPLVAAALTAGNMTRAMLLVRVEEMVADLNEQGAVFRLPPQGLGQTLVEGLEPLIARGLVVEGPDGLHVTDAEMIGFYAASVLQRVGNSDAAHGNIDRLPTPA
ncbi:MAG: 1-acyl-sn-glycerol-3-phosphate acyltransferase [Paracoccaceae bacterium]